MAAEARRILRRVRCRWSKNIRNVLTRVAPQQSSEMRYIDLADHDRSQAWPLRSAGNAGRQRGGGWGGAWCRPARRHRRVGGSLEIRNDFELCRGGENNEFFDTGFRQIDALVLL